ncbi:MAG: hypothetical protein HY738_21295 [Bacteroidia bacterium]|nr:hypothetical protein [Bacteroidia bacterium]
MRQLKSEGSGIKAFTGSPAQVKNGISEDAKVIKEIPSFETVILLDYFNGSFGVLADTTFGFIEKQYIITDFKIESYMTIWENKVKALLKEEEIRQRSIQREEEWQKNFNEPAYATGNLKIDKAIENPFSSVKYSKVNGYNFSLKNERSTSIVKEGKLNELIEFPGCELTVEQCNDFFRIITDTILYGREPPLLFSPKIGIVFYGKNEEILEYIDIDLDNIQLKSSVYIPAINYYNYWIDSRGNPITEGQAKTINGAQIISQTGFTKQGKEILMEYFRKLKLNVSSYPPVFLYGFDLSWSMTGYYNEIPKICPAFVANFARNSFSVGPRLWLGNYYGFGGNFATGLQYTYKYYISPYGKRFKTFVFFDFDYSYYREISKTNQGYYQIVKKNIENFINFSIGPGLRYRVYKNLHIHLEAGIGKGFSSGRNVYYDPVNTGNNYENVYGFFKGFFWDTPSSLVKAGLYYHFL